MGATNCNAKVTYKLQLIVFEKDQCITSYGASCKLYRPKLEFGLFLTSYLKSEILMKRSSDILLPRALLSIQQLSFKPVLAMMYCDGLVEYRETTNMNVIPRDGKDQISSIAQVGLYFPESRFCKLHVDSGRTPDVGRPNHEDDFL